MSAFLEDQSNYFYCNKNLILSTIDILKLVLNVFGEKEIVDFSEIHCFLCKELKTTKINSQELKKLVGRKNFVSKQKIENLIKVLNGDFENVKFIIKDGLIVPYAEIYKSILRFFIRFQCKQLNHGIRFSDFLWISKEELNEILSCKNSINGFCSKQVISQYAKNCNVCLGSRIEEITLEDIQMSREFKAELDRYCAIKEEIRFLEKQEDSIVNEISNISANERNVQYYFCSETVKIPLKSVVEAIYMLYLEKQATSKTIDEIKKHLSEKFNIERFNINREGLKTLLTSQYVVTLSTVRNLYSEYVLKNSIKGGNILKKFFLVLTKNKEKLLNTINVLGIEFLVDVIKSGAKNCICITNELNYFLNNSNSKIKLAGTSKDEFFNIEETEVLAEFLSLYNEDEWVEILHDETKIVEVFSRYIEQKEAEQGKLYFKKEILDMVKNVHFDNKSARLKFLFKSQGLLSVFTKYGFNTVKDLCKMTKKIAIECYVHKEYLVETLKRLEKSLLNKWNKTFIEFLKMRNKDGKVNKNWKNWLIILEERAKGKTLEQAGLCLGMTRERVRQAEKKYFLDFYKQFFKQDINFIDEITSLVKDSLFITDYDIIRIFQFNPSIFKYFLVNLEINEIEYISDLNKFYFVEEYDWYKELIVFSEKMPEQLSEKEMAKQVNMALNILKKNNINISSEDCFKVLTRGYKVFGEFYSKKDLTISQKIKKIMIKYFPNGAYVYDEDFLLKFRKEYEESFNADDLKSDHAIISIIMRIGVSIDKGKYIVGDKMFMSKKLANKIYKFIVESKREIFLINNLFELFKNELEAEGITNKYFLQGAFKQWFGEDLYFKKSYISTNKETTSIYGEIYKYIKDCHRIVSYEELQQEFIGIQWSVVCSATNQENILNYKSKYVHIDELKLTQEDKTYLKNSLSTFVSDGEIHHMNDILAYIRISNNTLLSKTYVEDQFALYSILEELFDDEFEFKRPFVARKGVKIDNQAERILEFISSYDYLKINDLIYFVNDNNLRLNGISEYIDSLNEYVFKDESSIIRLEKTNLNKYNVEVVETLVLRELGNKEFIFADELKFFNLYPKEVLWTPWLLYSALNKLSDKLKAIPSSTKFKVKDVIFARPIIVRRNVPAKNIKEYIEYLKGELNLNEMEFYKFLVTNKLVD